jgi:hypothetical protein
MPQWRITGLSTICFQVLRLSPSLVKPWRTIIILRVPDPIVTTVKQFAIILLRINGTLRDQVTIDLSEQEKTQQRKLMLCIEANLPGHWTLQSLTSISLCTIPERANQLTRESNITSTIRDIIHNIHLHGSNERFNQRLNVFELTLKQCMPLENGCIYDKEKEIFFRRVSVGLYERLRFGGCGCMLFHHADVNIYSRILQSFVMVLFPSSSGQSIARYA